MYNLFVGYVGPDAIENEITVSKSRYLEHTDPNIQAQFGTLGPNNVRELKSWPGLFMYEHCDGGAFVAEIKSITESTRNFKISFELRAEYDLIPEDIIKNLHLDLDIGEYELFRTHWAVKNADLFSVLSDQLDALPPSKKVTEEIPENLPPLPGSSFNMKQVFIVHGHDAGVKGDVSDYLKSLGLSPIILAEQASGGRTIIENIDYYSNVGCGIVLYTECDVGAKRNTTMYKWRARQNVIFEHGYLIGKLGRERVLILFNGDVEAPSDINGTVHISMDPAGNWKKELDKELRNIGYLNEE